MKTIILVRHGQSETNVQKVFTGQIDAPLTELGRKQAQLMAEYVDQYHVDKIYVSPLQRAVDTANAIAQRQGCMTVKCDALMEINAGAWQGLSFEEIGERFPRSYANWRADIGAAAPENGETCAQLYTRVTHLFEELLHGEVESFCLVAHATPIRMIESYISGRGVAAAQEIPWVPNASVTVYRYDGDFHTVVQGACDFLGELQTNLPKSI
ncbi:MAG: histidine phosphatase family protein [Ruminococcaceae bacterium]|nr:histidine phosphatase family protein [Oscillospiraceae bacterium]